MDHVSAARIKASPEFKELMQARRKLVTPFLLLILACYFGFILMVAFAPQALGHRPGDGVTSIGIYIGFALLILCFLINGFYLKLAAKRLDPLLQDIRAKALNHK